MEGGTFFMTQELCQCKLSHSIEDTRHKMMVLATNTSMLHQDVIAVSKELDHLIIQYIHLKMKQ